MTIEQNLINETQKWLHKIQEKRKHMVLLDESKKDLIVNMDAYISDSRHFTEKKMYIEAFEAVVWAWSILELLERLGIVEMRG